MAWSLGMKQSWEGWGPIVSYIWGHGQRVGSVHGELSYLYGGMFCSWRVVLSVWRHVLLDQVEIVW